MKTCYNIPIRPLSRAETQSPIRVLVVLKIMFLFLKMLQAKIFMQVKPIVSDNMKTVSSNDAAAVLELLLGRAIN